LVGAICACGAYAPAASSARVRAAMASDFGISCPAQPVNPGVAGPCPTLA
jgi:hypothetical protein